MPPQDVPATVDVSAEIDQALAVLELLSPEKLYEAATRKRVEKLYKRIRSEYLRRLWAKAKA